MTDWYTELLRVVVIIGAWELGQAFFGWLLRRLFPVRDERRRQ